MRLENIVALTDAKLLNKPFVSSFESVCYKLSSLKRGDLFIAQNDDDIPDAIKKGAYCILFDFNTKITDNEIAWIKVDNIIIAMIKIIRFNLLSINCKAYECDDITIKLALQITTHKSVKILEGDIFNIFNILQNIDQNTLVLFSDSFCYKDIFINIKHLSNTTSLKINIIEQTLFETSFIYDNIFYGRKLLSPFFIPYLQRLLQLFKNERINFSILSFTTIKHFEAIFVNNNFQQQEFGNSDKVLIFEPSLKPISLQIDFLRQQANWAHTIYLLPTKNVDMVQDMTNIFTYDTQLDIIKILKLKRFHFALIAGQDKSFLDHNNFISKQQQLTFDL